MSIFLSISFVLAHALWLFVWRAQPPQTADTRWPIRNMIAAPQPTKRNCWGISGCWLWPIKQICTFFAGGFFLHFGASFLIHTRFIMPDAVTLIHTMLRIVFFLPSPISAKKIDNKSTNKIVEIKRSNERQEITTAFVTIVQTKSCLRNNKKNCCCCCCCWCWAHFFGSLNLHYLFIAFASRLLFANVWAR